jgi:cholesterol transport system auxiliary component
MHSWWGGSRCRPGPESERIEVKLSLPTLAPLTVLALTLGGCALLAPTGAAPPSLFVLAPPAGSAPPRDVGTRAIAVAPPGARPGFDGPRMAYVTRPYEVQYFARHQWVDAPARMLAPLLADALGRGGRLDAMQGGERVAPALRLETEVVVLQQEFDAQPSQVRFTLRARLLDLAERRELANSTFEAVEAAPSDDPYGGVVAANRAVARVLDEVAKWCTESAP